MFHLLISVQRKGMHIAQLSVPQQNQSIITLHKLLLTKMGFIIATGLAQILEFAHLVLVQLFVELYYYYDISISKC